MRSNFDLTSFSDRARYETYASRKEYSVYRCIRVETPDKDRSSEFKKSEKVKKIEKIDRVIFFRSSS